MFRRPLKLLALGIAAAALLLLSACAGIKPESRALIQPMGIGMVHAGVTLCTYPSEGEGASSCGPSGESVQGQMMVLLVVPAGAGAPESFTASPSLGSTTLNFTRNPEVGAAFASNTWAEAAETITEEPVPPLSPAGFEVVGYLSGVLSETAGQAQEWPVDVAVALPPAADGGSYGGPFKVTLLNGWREVTPALPASRPVSCSGEEFGNSTTICEPNISGAELTVGASELKIASPQPVAAVPGATARLPFSLDLASGAAPPPAFKLGVAANLKGAKDSVSNDKFNRFPSSAPPYRAPLTTRKAVIGVPKTALPGTYEVTMSATTPQGGSVSSVAKLQIKPKGKLTVKVPKTATARLASRRGIPVKVTARTARTRVVARLFGPKPNGKGKRLLAKKRLRSKEPGPLILRLKLGKARVAALAREGAKLRAEVKVFEPKKKGRKFVRVVRLK